MKISRERIRSAAHQLNTFFTSSIVGFADLESIAKQGTSPFQTLFTLSHDLVVPQTLDDQIRIVVQNPYMPKTIYCVGYLIPQYPSAEIISVTINPHSDTTYLRYIAHEQLATHGVLKKQQLDGTYLHMKKISHANIQRLQNQFQLLSMI